MNINKDITPLEIIRLIRESFHGSKIVYTQGSCYKLYEILKGIFPDAVPYYDEIDGHIYTLIDGKYYDIYGELTTSLISKLTPTSLLPNIEACMQSWSWSLETYKYELLQE